MEMCPSCGQPARFEVAEVFPTLREVHVDACCESNRAGWIDAIRECSRKERRAWMLRETGIRVHDVLADDDTIHWTLDYGLRIEEIEFDDAKEFIAEHHRHCEPPLGWMFGAAVFNGNELVAVMTAGQPVSRVLARRGYLEVNRVCAKDIAPHALVFNACSMLYGYACRKGFERGTKEWSARLRLFHSSRTHTSIGLPFMKRLPLMRDQICDMAISILRATEDGDKLAPHDLKLVGLAVNGRLDEDGEGLFQALYQNAIKPGGYTVPYLFGIENLTIDHYGIIRWRGTPVEHFDHAV